ncbi:MAG TPA: hypothetical protein VHG91_12520 [Longimicrobium sp.]|nr:hypothetical protein [Longimicrobium sp.]
METTFIGLVGDVDPDVVAHRAIGRALWLANLSLGRMVEAVWIATPDAAADPAGSLADIDAVWCVPGSPYRSMEGALAAIRLARERGLPFLGTCGGFQHALVEIARNVAGVEGADHAESSPGADRLVVTGLACPLVEVPGTVALAEGSRIRAAYGAAETTEEYHCSFGFNPAFRPVLEAAGVRFTAFDSDGGVRALELPDHPFFVATLFQPERAALHHRTPPLVRAFVQAAVSARRSVAAA